MRVIKTKYVGESFATCNHCGAEIAYFPCDVKILTRPTFNYEYIICPACTKAITLRCNMSMKKEADNETMD